MMLKSLLTGLRGRVAMQAEIIALRHQLIVFQRTQKPKRIMLKGIDRCLWVWLSRLWSGWQSSLIMVKPETVIRWHHQGFRWYWTWKVRHGQSGRPRVPKETRDLIRIMSRENPLWGAPRIHSELLKLGFRIAQASVAKYMVRNPKPPSQTWRTFLTNHVSQLVSVDFFTVHTVWFEILFVFIVLAHGRAVWGYPPPRSRRSDRDLPLGSVALEGLRNWRQKRKGGPDDLVFALYPKTAGLLCGLASFSHFLSRS